jgi:hypothetical protein
VTGSFEGTAIFGLGEPNEITFESAGDTDIFIAKWGEPEQQADVFLTELRAPRVIKTQTDITHQRRVFVFGDGDSAIQDAIVSLSFEVPPGIEVEVEPDAVTEPVVPDRPWTRFSFLAEIECEEPGSYEVQWTATIDADENADPANDTAEAVAAVECREATR